MFSALNKLPNAARPLGYVAEQSVFQLFQCIGFAQTYFSLAPSFIEQNQKTAEQKVLIQLRPLRPLRSAEVTRLCTGGVFVLPLKGKGHLVPLHESERATSPR
jgi:hypothetical protein